ncbi:MAG: M48 family metalloprotease [Candidatus Cloacimonetes bacterium]|nr:M48 family metalloprotease [Candidatus Cloacimonadota bacterium]
MKKFILLFATVLLLGAMFAQDVVVKRDRTYMRSGAGSYYPVISQIPVNTKISLVGSKDSWLKVTYKNQTGYISATSTQAQKPKTDAFAKMNNPSSSASNVTQHSISAGVKGFGERFSSDFKGDSNFLELAMNASIDPQRYSEFAKTTYSKSNRKDFFKAHNLPRRDAPDYYTEAQEGFGLGVASVIASNGLLNNPSLTEYVSYVGNILVEASDVADVQFRFFILDLPSVNAYACPGGYIFITKGMLQMIRNEAELAFVLAHEIAHISKFHGMIETKLRENQIGAESVFSMLDEELPDFMDEEHKAIEEDLEADIRSMYESLIDGRLDAYEKEADDFGILFTARAGYDPSQSIELLNRLLASRSQSNNQHYRPESISERTTWVKRQAALHSKPRQKYFTHSARWQQNVRF